jgi:hypothetical protein
MYGMFMQSEHLLSSADPGPDPVYYAMSKPPNSVPACPGYIMMTPTPYRRDASPYTTSCQADDHQIAPPLYQSDCALQLTPMMQMSRPNEQQRVSRLPPLRSCVDCGWAGSQSGVAWAGEGTAALQLSEDPRHASSLSHQGDERQDGGDHTELAQAEGDEREVAGGQGEVEGGDEGGHGMYILVVVEWRRDACLLGGECGDCDDCK